MFCTRLHVSLTPLQETTVVVVNALTKRGSGEELLGSSLQPVRCSRKLPDVGGGAVLALVLLMCSSEAKYLDGEVGWRCCLPQSARLAEAVEALPEVAEAVGGIPALQSALTRLP